MQDVLAKLESRFSKWPFGVRVAIVLAIFVVLPSIIYSATR